MEAERRVAQLLEQHEAAQDWLREQVKGLQAPPEDSAHLRGAVNTLKVGDATRFRCASSSGLRGNRPLFSGLAPDGTAGARGDGGPGRRQRPSARPLHPRGRRRSDAGGRPPSRALRHLGAGLEGAPDDLRGPPAGAGPPGGPEDRGAERESRRLAVGAELAGRGARPRPAPERHPSDAAALGQPAGRPRRPVSARREHRTDVKYPHVLFRQNCDTSLEELRVQIDALGREVAAASELPSEIIVTAESLLQQHDRYGERPVTRRALSLHDGTFTFLLIFLFSFETYLFQKNVAKVGATPKCVCSP